VNGLAGNDQRGETELCTVVCESAAVTVSAQPTGNGTRLRLRSARSGATVLLDATVLDALCRLTPERAAELVRESVERGEER
jgi:hypothetical protein